jgi:hypothetical protein
VQAKLLRSAVYTGTEPSAQVQLARSGEPGLAVDWSGHDTHSVPSAEEYEFDWQAVQPTAPRCEKEPGEQARQVPFFPMKLPALQGVHTTAPAPDV